MHPDAASSAFSAFSAVSAACVLPARHRVLAVLAAGLCLPALGGCATAVPAHPALVDLTVIDRASGQTLPLYRHQGRSYVAGRPAARYALRLSNQSAGRVLVVLSVDGVNVVSGQTASWDQAGYVLEPGQGYDITGWRKNEATVAAFEFAALQDSYAARTGRPGHVGVIGMAVFLEKAAPPVARQVPETAAAAKSDQGAADRASGAEATGAARERRASSAAPRAEKLGTAHGQREWSHARRTTFERLTSTPQAVIEIAYDSHQNLVAAGVIGTRGHIQARAFPLSDASFVPDPPVR
jgi:hypothetical protein